MEEHGFEVVSVYPNSPAARAGLIGRTGSTPAGEWKALGSLLLGPVALVTFPMLRKSGALGTDGDLIVAVDDVRVRTREEMLHALGHLKPGDITYITVIRPLPGGYHRTMRIALHIDHLTDAAGKHHTRATPEHRRAKAPSQSAPPPSNRRSPASFLTGCRGHPCRKRETHGSIVHPLDARSHAIFCYHFP